MEEEWNGMELEWNDHKDRMDRPNGMESVEMDGLMESGWI